MWEGAEQVTRQVEPAWVEEGHSSQGPCPPRATSVPSAAFGSPSGLRHKLSGKYAVVYLLVLFIFFLFIFY